MQFLDAISNLSPPLARSTQVAKGRQGQAGSKLISTCFLVAYFLPLVVTGLSNCGSRSSSPAMQARNSAPSSRILP
jgi:hypothetical protein